MNRNYPKITGWVLFVTLLFLFSIHVYWGAGGLWPGDSPESLSGIVMGQPGAVIPLGVETYLISTVFLLFGLLALVPFTPLQKLLPQKFYIILFYVVSGVFFLRVVFGYTEELFMPSAEGAPYIFWNRVLYSPLCLSIGLGYLYIVRSVYRKD